MRIFLILILVAVMATAQGCSPYRIDIQQGNVIEDKDLARLQVGMSKQQVVFIMGSPLLVDPFHPQRWDYVYTLKLGSEDTTERKHLALYFDGDTLARIEKSEAPASPSASP